ncbi:MAG: hypothetical protein KAS32_28035, partial [Candidatus Peribacteraceae bacterium]|nr:hypothetical protein [Candidatus Peribacteraceae bacterium]
NSFYQWQIDTERDENTSGIYRVANLDEEDPTYGILMVDENLDNRTVEYTQLSNGTYNFTFDFRKNGTFKYAGPVRIVLEQKGDEIIWNQPANKTGEGYLIKRYTFYRDSRWIKIEQTFVNNATYNITRNSTISGALAFNINYSMVYIGAQQWYNNMSETTDPGSYGWATKSTGGGWLGIVNVEENATNNFFGLHDSDNRRLGIQLNPTNITPGNSIGHTAHVMFNGTGGAGAENYFLNFVNQSITPLNISQHTPEVRTVGVDGTFNVNVTTQATIFNRNETVLIRANITDLYNLHDNVNVTLDLGGAGELNLTLYDDGSHYDGAASDNLYGNTYNLSDTSAVDVWNATFNIYNATGYSLNVTIVQFNVTDVYNVTVNITNPTGFTERMINATVTVKNYRKDTSIIGALVNCSFVTTEIPQGNVTDNGDGTYLVEFGAPIYVDLFTLNCTASRNNNTGEDTDEFTCEEYRTNVSLTLIPDNLTYDNVTSYANQGFNITVVAENIANGSAYEPNITISFPNVNITANETFSQCSDILISKNCTKTFEIIVFNSTPAGEYMVNVSIDWRNSDSSPGSYNETMLNVTVLQNTILEVTRNQILGLVAANRTLKNIDNFTVRARGNEQLSDIQFNVTGFSSDFEIQFLPTSITSLGVGNDQNVQIFANTTNNIQPGEYNGTINITTSNDGEHLINLTIAVTGTNMSIAVNITNYTAGNVTWYDNESFFIFVNASNIKNATAYNSSIILNFSDTGITANETEHDCGNVPKSESCEVYFTVTILNGTRSGNYMMNVSVEWANPEYGVFTNTSTVNITVLSNITFEIPTDEVSANITHGSSEQVGVILINSTGNDPVTNITAYVTNFSDYNITLTVTPTSIVTLDGNYPGGVEINASVPYGFSSGIYNGTINVTTNNSIYKEINLTLEVPVSRNWTMNVSYCEQFQLPPEGIACMVNINNTGNIDAYIDITPVTSSSSMYNNTWTNITEFNLTKGSDQNVTVYYNVTDQPLIFYYANYTVNATQAGATPPSETLQIVLNPFIRPEVSIALVYDGVVQNQSEQTDEVWIYANVTDLSGAGVESGNVTVTVTRPDGSNSTIDMFHYSGTAPVTRWESRYPNDPVQGNWGDTTQKGYYNVTVIAIDNRGKNETITYQLYVYSKLTPYFMTTSQYYYSYIGASTPIIYFKSLDFTEGTLPQTNVTFVIRDSNYSTIYSSYNFTTNADGYIEYSCGTGTCEMYLETTSFASFPLDNYTATANSVYYDSVANVTVSDETNYTFELLESAGTLANVLVYPTYYTSNNIVKFRMWVTNSMGSLVDPQIMNITVYDPAANEFFNRSLSQMTRVSQGVYIYNHAMPATPAVGIYDVTLEVTGQDGTHTYDFSTFRIGTGGPYDVWIDPIENQVYQADYLDFGINMKNMGDSPTENFVEYWITGLSDNTTWNYG